MMTESGLAAASDADVLLRMARFGAVLGSERDPERVVQRVTDEATSLVGAEFGAFFYNVVERGGECYMLYALSGAPREAFSKFPMPRNTSIFAPTFAGEAIMRIDDVLVDPRYGKNAPYRGMPEGHLPVRSYLAAPVKTPEGKVLGGLFFGHGAPGVFDERAERALGALAGLAGTALESARLFTELRAREEEIRASELRYRLVSEAMQEGIRFWEVATNHIEWNERLLELVGVSRGDWGGTFDDWSARLHPDDQPMMSAALDAHLTRHAPYRIEAFRLRHADGSWRWFSTVGQAEWGADGRPLRMAGSVRDVTEAKLAQDRVRATELRVSQILDSIEDMIFTKDEDLQITWANAATCRFHGATLPALRQRAVEQNEQDDRDVLAAGRTIERLEDPRVALDGETHTFHTVKTPLRDPSGKVAELVAVSRDVTARKREADAQRLLAEASAILSASIDWESTLGNVARATVPRFADWAAVDMLDASGSLTRLAVHHADPSKVTLAHELERRYPTDMSAGTGVPQVLRTHQVEWVPEIQDSLLVGGSRDEEHLRIVRALGLRSYIIVPIVIGNVSVGAISFVSAESRRRYTEADVAFASELARRAAVAVENARLYREVRELAATLERRVEERTQALLQANQELEAFSYTVSHDLRAPVRHVGGFVDLLRSHAGDGLDDKGRRYLDTIKSASTQMGVLIDGLLAFSRLGRSPVAKRRVSLADMVRDVIRELEPELVGRDVTWSVSDLPEVAGDPTMLRIVLANLLNNAVKYTRPRPSAHIAVTARREGDEHVVAVRDDGVGFNTQYTHKLFGVFQRLHTDNEFEGSGIGLATVRRIVSKHGGRTWAEPVEPHGAAFSFSLPIEEP